MEGVESSPTDTAAAVDGHDLTGDEWRIRGEEQGRAGDIHGRARSFQRRSVNDFFLKSRIGDAVRRPHHRTRGNRVDSNMWAKFACQRFRQHNQTGFGDGVGRIAPQRPHAMDVDDVQNQTVRHPQGWCRRLREKQRCFEIRPDQIVPVLEGDLTDWCRVEGRCVVDQDVELAKVPPGFFDEHAERGDIEQIGRQSERAVWSRLLELCAQFLSGIDRSMVMNDYVGTCGMQLARNRSADSTGSARDEGDFAGEGWACSVGCHGESL